MGEGLVPGLAVSFLGPDKELVLRFFSESDPSGLGSWNGWGGGGVCPLDPDLLFLSGLCDGRNIYPKSLQT